MPPIRHTLRGLALLLIGALTLPNPAFALRTTGLEETPQTKQELVAQLTAGLEEVALDERLTGKYPYQWRLDEIRRLHLGNERLEKFQRLYGGREDDPRPGDIPPQAAEGDPADLARWRAENNLDLEALRARISRVQEMHPPDPERVVMLGPKLATYQQFIQDHPESNFVWLGVKEYKTPSHSFKYRQFIDAFFTDILDVTQKGLVKPAYAHGAAMFSSGNAILGALETVDWLKTQGWLPSDFKITLIAMQELAPNKLKKIQVYKDLDHLDRVIYVEKDIAVEYQRARKAGTVADSFTSISVDASGFPNALEDINQVLLLVDWWAQKEHKYHLQASNSISAVVGGASLYEDVRLAMQDRPLDYLTMTFGGAIPVVGQALAATVHGDHTQILGVRSTIPTESIADSVRINMALPIGREGLRFFGSKRLRLVEAPELAWIKAVVEFHRAGIQVEPTAIGPAALLFTIMANDPGFFERFHKAHGRPLVIATVLSGENYDQEAIQSSETLYQEFALDRLASLQFPAAGLEGASQAGLARNGNLPAIPAETSTAVTVQTQLEPAGILLHTDLGSKYIIDDSYRDGDKVVWGDVLAQDGSYRTGFQRSFSRSALNDGWTYAPPRFPAPSLQGMVSMALPNGVSWRPTISSELLGVWSQTRLPWYSEYDHSKIVAELPALSKFPDEVLHRGGEVYHHATENFRHTDYVTQSQLVYRTAPPGVVAIWKLVANDGTIGLEVIVQDAGPGIRSLDRAIQEPGFSTSGTDSLGLPFLLDAADEVAIHSLGKVWVKTRATPPGSYGTLLDDRPDNGSHPGTTVVARIWPRAAGMEEAEQVAQEMLKADGAQGRLKEQGFLVEEAEPGQQRLLVPVVELAQPLVKRPFVYVHPGVDVPEAITISLPTDAGTARHMLEITMAVRLRSGATIDGIVLDATRVADGDPASWLPARVQDRRIPTVVIQPTTTLLAEEWRVLFDAARRLAELLHLPPILIVQSVTPVTIGNTRYLLVQA